MNAFVVEDNQGIREIVTCLLEERGHTVAAFEDAESALPALRCGSFQIGIMDWGLPGMDGLQLCRQYRGIFPDTETVIIILTGRAEPDDLEEVVAAGANDYITKPFKLDILETRVAFAERLALLKAKEIRERESRTQTFADFRSLIESIPVITYIEVGDRSRQIRYISPQIEDLMGWTPEEVMASPGFWMDILHPDDESLALEEESSSNTEIKRFSLEYRQRCRNGEYRWFRDEAEPVFDETGNKLFWHGAILDIHAQKEFEIALQDEERRHRELSIAAERQANELRLLDRVRSAIAHELDLPNIFRIVVEAMTDVLGYSHTSLYRRIGDELILQYQVGYQNPSTIYHTLVRGQGVIGNVGFTGIPRLITDTGTDPDFLVAEIDVVSEMCVPLFDERAVVGAINVETTADQPLTEDDLRMLQGVADLVNSAISRSRLLAEARESERRLRSVLNDVREVVFTTDSEGRWTFLNRAWEEISGFPLEQSLGRAAFEFTVPESAEAMRSTVNDLREGHIQDVRGDFELVTACGNRRWIEAHATRVGDGEDVYISGTLSDITDRRVAETALTESQERYRHQALHDALTSLPNRTLFMERLDEALRTTAENSSALSVLYLDLDGFKLVNDTFGHEAGDTLLVQVAERLNRSLRGSDTVARLGGDEFALLVEDDGDFTISAAISGRILDSFRQPFIFKNQEVSLATSIGVASHRGADGRANHLLRNADTALYVAKSRGRGAVVNYQPKMSAAVVARFQQETQLRQVIEEGAFELCYQPVFDLNSNQIVSIEAVLQWPTRDRGALISADIYTLAESTGLSAHLGEVALRLACRDLANWKRLLESDLPVLSIRLLAKQLRDAALADRVLTTLQEHDLASDRLEFVIDEPGFSFEESYARSVLHELRSAGLGLRLDSVGSGHGTLSALRELPLSALRIDQFYVHQLGKDRAIKEIVRAITNLSQTLGMTVTAAGIENIDQLAHARSVGIDRGIGPHFAGPLNAEGVFSLLMSRRPAEPSGVLIKH